MSCGKDAAHCKRIAAGQGAPEAVVTWAEGRGAGGHCPECGGFLTTEGACNNPHTFSMSLAGGLLGIVDTTELGVCPDCGATLSVAPGKEDWCMQCEELVNAFSSELAGHLRALKDDNPGARQNAAWALGNAHAGDPAAIPALEKALGDTFYAVRQNAAWALGKIGDPVAIPALEKALEDTDPKVRRNATLSLVMCGGVDEKNLAIFTSNFKAFGHLTRAETARELGKTHNSAGVTFLTQTGMKDKSKSVFDDVIRSLCQLRDPAAIPSLAKSLTTKNRHRKQRIINAIGDIGVLESADLLIPLLGDDDEYTRLGTVDALGKLGNPAAVPMLINCFENDPLSHIRLWTAQALGEIGDPAAVPALEKVLAKNESPRMNKIVRIAINNIKKASK